MIYSIILFIIQVSSIHASLSLAVANEILSCPEAPGVRILCNILPMMDLTGCQQSTVKEMKILTARMTQVLRAIFKVEMRVGRKS